MKRNYARAFGLLAYVLPVAWVLLESRALAAGVPEGGYICGLPMMAIIVLACFGAMALSTVGIGFGIANVIGGTHKVSISQVLELSLIVVPLLIGVSGVVFFLSA